MDYKNLPDTELAKIMVNYINRVDHLRQMIAQYLDHSDGGAIPADRIKATYKELKYELRDDAAYLDLVRNYNGSELYMDAFRPSIREAYAFGFGESVNSKISQAFYSTVADAHYKLTKIYSLEEWGQFM